MNTPDEKRARNEALMMAALDGELSPEHSEAFQALLRKDPALRLEYETLKRNQNLMKNQKLTEPVPEFWDTWNQQLFTRIERGFGWVLFTLGALLLLGYTAWIALEEILTEPALPFWVKAAVVLLTAGTLILLVSLARERWFTRKNERYKDIVR
ncbi:hypothetical protein CYPRO_0771 [Cyclonatronum proteinivorum]|uniref:Uncharacterized protein n=1 Tax=Cyclonatronum proteinivorum TaxID=1457365 RepID=A0A345UHV2_9BACT|nr:hypothetical protein [Cyclonatronum proteinivorum]AXJ00054.1 hypothetical protein CYPRO_0771 [Cyclonatronum proteinivorum]